MTYKYDHPTKQRSGAFVKKRRILEVKMVQVDSKLNIYNGGKLEKRVGLSTGSSRRRCKKMDDTIVTGDDSKLFTAAFQTYREGGVDHLVVGNFGEINKEFKEFISNTALLLTGQTKDTANMTPANWTDVGNSDATRLIRKKFKVALGGMTVRAQNELLLKQLQFICNSLIATTQAANAVPPRGYFYEYGNSTFNDRSNADAYNNFRSYNNLCPYEGEDDKKEKNTGNERNGKHVTKI